MSGPVVGIDLGTSNSVVAIVQGSKANIIPDREGRRIQPSIVSFHPNGKVLVGHEAKNRLMIDPANTVYSAKRLIGRIFRSEQVQAAAKRAPYELIEGENQQPMVVARGKRYTIPEISAYILRYLRGLAEAYTGEKVTQAVITVPANFDDAQREATKSAGRIAGLEVLRILNEPTAAALAYGYGRGVTSRVAIYDFGGGTFDITSLQLNDRIFEVLSTAGDTFLGGDDIDNRIVDYMEEVFLREHRVDLSYNLTALARLRTVAEQVKCQLSSRPKRVVQVKELAYGQGGESLDLNFTLTVEALNAMSRELVQRSFLICDEALRLAELAATQVDDVVLVGGLTRMPLIKAGVTDYFNREPRTDINPDEVVGVGAAVQAASLSRTSDAGGPSAVLLDVTPRALGIAVVGGYTDTIIQRNVQIPVEQTRRFATGQDNQTSVRIQVCQGESPNFLDNQPLGELLLEDLRPAIRGQVHIDVTFEIDTDGILQIRAVDVETGRQQRARVNVLGTVTEEEMRALMEKHDELPTILDVDESGE
jgi:molecular chaperone DnaK